MQCLKAAQLAWTVGAWKPGGGNTPAGGDSRVEADIGAGVSGREQWILTQDCMATADRTVVRPQPLPNLSKNVLIHNELKLIFLFTWKCR